MGSNQLLVLFLGIIFASILIKSYENANYSYAFKPIYEHFKVENNKEPGSLANIEEGPTSYLLLADKLKGYPADTKAIGPTSHQCFKVDWTRNQERAGSYAQGTNNFKRNYPDSCSSWNHDLVLDFYRPSSC